jgi:uncharacterized membrane protein
VFVGTRLRIIKPKQPPKKTLSDRCSEIIGSWKFIGTQATVLFLWLTLNTFSPIKWDQPPFILLNLMLSFQAAFTGPVLLMAANRQSEIDRKRDIDHYLIDVRDSELLQDLATQIEHIHKHVEHHDEEHW